MKVTPHHILPEVLLIEPDVFRDNRGHFLETYRTERYLSSGIDRKFVQDNTSYSKRDVLRGLHYQLGRPQAKLVWVTYGEVFDVAVDVRKGSPSFGKWAGIELSSANYRQIYIPEGFAHGFCVTSDMAIVSYKCTEFYVPEEERGIRWDDPLLNIDWPIPNPVVSVKDQRFPILKNMPSDDLPTFENHHLKYVIPERRSWR